MSSSAAMAGLLAPDSPAVFLPRGVLRALRRRALLAYPEEACGALVGAREPSVLRVEGLAPGRNLHPEPRTGFELHPATIVRAEQRARARGLELIGFFHSHPDGSPVPSEADRAALWAEYLSLIVAVDARGRTRVQASLLRDGRIRSTRFLVIQG